MTEKRTVFLVIVCVLVLKVCFLLWGGVKPFQGADSASFYSLAESVSQGRGLQYRDNGAPDLVLRSFRPPLYPLVMGGLFRLFGVHPQFVLVFQLLLGTLAVWVLYRLARLLFSDAAARWTAILGALYWTSMFFEDQIYSEALFVFLFLVANYLAVAAVRGRWRGGAWRPAALAGLFYGLSVLCRPSAIFTIPFAAIWVYWTGRRERTRALAGAAAVLAFTVIALVPWWIRNYEVHGTFVPLVTSGGLNFWSGNEANGSRDALSAAWSIMKDNPNRLSEPGLDRWFYHDAWAAILANPAHFAVMLKQKALFYWWPFQESFYQLPYRLLYVFFLLGLGVSLRMPGRSGPVLLIIGSQFVVAAAYATHSRYRYSIDFYVILLAAVGLEALSRFAPAGRSWVGKALSIAVPAGALAGWLSRVDLASAFRVWMLAPVSAIVVLLGFLFLRERKEAGSLDGVSG